MKQDTVPERFTGTDLAKEQWPWDHYFFWSSTAFFARKGVWNV